MIYSIKFSSILIINKKWWQDKVSRICELFLKSTHELCQYIITPFLVCRKNFGLVHFTVFPICEFCTSAANKELLQQIKVFVGAMKSVKALTRTADEEKRIAKIEGEKTEQSRLLPYSKDWNWSKKKVCLQRQSLNEQRENLDLLGILVFRKGHRTQVGPTCYLNIFIYEFL